MTDVFSDQFLFHVLLPTITFNTSYKNNSNKLSHPKIITSKFFLSSPKLNHKILPINWNNTVIKQCSIIRNVTKISAVP